MNLGFFFFFSSVNIEDIWIYLNVKDGVGFGILLFYFFIFFNFFNFLSFFVFCMVFCIIWMGVRFMVICEFRLLGWGIYIVEYLIRYLL